MVYEVIGSSDVEWAGKTYAEIVELAEGDGALAVVPVGSIEQHGHHLPVATDTILASAVAQLGAERASDDVPLVVTPPVWSGYSPHHLSFGGTITLEVEHLLTMLEDVGRSILDNGFDALLFVNGHGGNGSILGSAVTTIGREHPDAQVLSISYYTLASSFIDDLRESDVGGTSHGGEFETSLMLHLRPELVDEEGIVVNYRDEPYDLARQDMFKGGPLSVYRSFEELTEEGPIGDPSVASADTGEELYDRLGDELAALIGEIHEQNR